MDRAYKKLLAFQPWPIPQRKWLERIAKEMKRSIIVDATTFEEGAFKNFGGLKNPQHVFGGEALAIIDEFEGSVWEEAA